MNTEDPEIRVKLFRIWRLIAKASPEIWRLVLRSDKSIAIMQRRALSMAWDVVDFLPAWEGGANGVRLPARGRA